VKRIRTAVITGATSGIGAAVARTLALSGTRVFLVGRDARKLAAAGRAIGPRRLAGLGCGDLASLTELPRLLKEIICEVRRLDTLVHCAGAYEWTEPGQSDPESFERLFHVNVRAPYLLTQGLLAPLARAKGQVIFFNSSVVKHPGQGLALYKATQHALQGLSDSLRQDLNRRGIRVSSLYPGRTATPRMRRIYAREGRRYRPAVLLSPADVAALVLQLTQLPPHLEVTDVYLRSASPY
jgi:NAD(P)-dependent dehydrogenase (short-subunit alcohol dehydrogenase family)